MAADSQGGPAARRHCSPAQLPTRAGLAAALCLVVLACAVLSAVQIDLAQYLTPGDSPGRHTGGGGGQQRRGPQPRFGLQSIAA